MVEVILNGVSLDLISSGVEYIKQANDLADISTVNSSYTYSIRADKTPKNTRTFQQLGMIGDTSETPYVKNSAQLLDGGAMLIEKGILTVTETSDEYKLKIQDGIVEIFKVIENKTLGKDLNLSELDHSKNEDTIVSSWVETDPAYIYLVADYNGKLYDGVNIDFAYQVPSVSVKYLWDKIFDYLGWTYSGDFSFIKYKYITYPSPPQITEGEPQGIAFATYGDGYSGDFNDSYKGFRTILADPEATPIDNWKIKINQTGRYNIYFNFAGSIDYHFFLIAANIYASRMFNFSLPFQVALIINGQVMKVGRAGDLTNYNGVIQGGSIVEIELQHLEEANFNPDDFEYPITERFYLAGNADTDELNITYGSLGVEVLGIEEINFRESLENISIKDFLKEVMFRGGLTPFTAGLKKHIEFKSIKERFSTETVQDLSKYYVRRTNEFYEFPDYAKNNYLRLKYNDDEAQYNDSFISVKNYNIKDEIDLFKSQFYTGDKLPVELTLSDNLKVPVLRMWNKEINDEGEVEYKALDNRFYYISRSPVGLNIQVGNRLVPKFYVARLSGTTMREVVESKYNLIGLVLEDTRIHEIELALSAYQFQSIDLETPKYFDQENQFYILNKLTWKTGEITKGEFLRLKKT